jgi:hypothetical protein
MHMENLQPALKSVIEIRERIVEVHTGLPPRAEAYDVLQRMLEACRRCQGHLEHGNKGDHFSGVQRKALVTMRGELGTLVKQLREVTDHHVIDRRLADSLIVKLLTGYVVPAFEYAMINALTEPGRWLKVPACLPDEMGDPSETDTVIGCVRIDEDHTPEGTLATRWVAIPTAWPFTFEQPGNWLQLVFDACFSQGLDADPVRAAREQIPERLDNMRNMLVFQQLELSLGD